MEVRTENQDKNTRALSIPVVAVGELGVGASLSVARGETEKGSQSM